MKNDDTYNKNKIETIKLDKNIMEFFCRPVKKQTTNGEIFKITRDCQYLAKKENKIIKNIVELYYYLIEYRDELKKAS